MKNGEEGYLQNAGERRHRTGYNTRGIADSVLPKARRISAILRGLKTIERHDGTRLLPDTENGRIHRLSENSDGIFDT